MLEVKFNSVSNSNTGLSWEFIAQIKFERNNTDEQKKYQLIKDPKAKNLQRSMSVFETMESFSF